MRSTVIYFAIFPMLAINSSQFGVIMDFKNIVTKAQKWGEASTKNWVISNHQKQAIIDYTMNDGGHINKYLRLTNGKLLNPKTDKTKYWTIFESFEVEKLNTKINHIDKALLKIHTPETLIVYKRVKEKFFDIPHGVLRSSDDYKINLDFFKDFQLQWNNQKMPIHCYLSSSLINEPEHFTFNHKWFPILLQIILPPKTHGAYIGHISRFEGEVEMLINRNHWLRYRDFKIIEIAGIETLKINASLFL